MSLCVDVIVKSSANDIMFMLAVVGGSVVHLDFKECGGLNRALGGSVGLNFLSEITCCLLTRVIIVNLSAAEFNQMLISDNDTKDSSRI